jgi:transcriptional regulator with XRE-family HTH domain
MDTAGFDLELGRNIRNDLQARDITLAEAAERTGIPYATLWRHLNTGGLSAREVYALAEILGTSVSALTEAAVA